jgi:aarF domain-containing kinase
LCACDAQVPSYDSKIAFATIERELGKPISEVYSEITPEPLAAASLGQVRVFVLVVHSAARRAEC